MDAALGHARPPPPSHQRIRTPSPRKHMRNSQNKSSAAKLLSSKSSPLNDSGTNVYIADLERRLREKESDAALAADIGQQLLRQVEQLQLRLSAYENMGSEFMDTENSQNTVNSQSSIPSTPRKLQMRFDLPPGTPSRHMQQQQRPLQQYKTNHGQAESADLSFVDLLKSNSELMERCQLQAELIQELQRSASESDDRIWNLELRNQELTEEIGRTIPRLEKALNESNDLKSQLRSYEPADTFDPVEDRCRSYSKQKNEKCQLQTISRGCSPIPCTPSRSNSSLGDINIAALETDIDIQFQSQDESALLQQVIERLSAENRDLSTGLQDAQNTIELLEAQLLEAHMHTDIAQNLGLELLNASRLPIQPRGTLTAQRHTPTTTRLGIVSVSGGSRSESIQTNETLRLQGAEYSPCADAKRSAGAKTPPTENTQFSYQSIEMLHAMIGMWARKLSNNSGSRYFWIQPWRRLLLWSKKRPMPNCKVIVRSVFVETFETDQTGESIIIRNTQGDAVLRFSSPPEDRQIWLRALRQISRHSNRNLLGG